MASIEMVIKSGNRVLRRLSSSHSRQFEVVELARDLVLRDHNYRFSTSEHLVFHKQHYSYFIPKDYVLNKARK